MNITVGMTGTILDQGEVFKSWRGTRIKITRMTVAPHITSYFFECLDGNQKGNESHFYSNELHWFKWDKNIKIVLPLP